MDLNALTDALANQDWPTVAALGGITVLTIAIAIMKLLGKDIGPLQKILDLLKVGQKLLPKKVAPAKPEDQPGLAQVVPIRAATPEEEREIAESLAAPVELSKKEPPQS